MKEQAYNKNKDQDSRTQQQSNLNKSKEARFKDLASGEIVSLKIWSQKWKLGDILVPTGSNEYLIISNFSDLSVGDFSEGIPSNFLFLSLNLSSSSST
ncbi:hypothetical protein Tco_0778660 [Tanacetum coccineum]